MDKLTKEQRHYNMSQIHGKDTQPEIAVRKYLFSRGLRYRKNDKRLPGHPDIVLPKYKTVGFVHGGFWHRHYNCKLAYTPKSNEEFWIQKFNNNIIRDKVVKEEVLKSELKMLVVWECTIKKMIKCEALLLSYLEKIDIFLHSDDKYTEI